ncbi:MAG: MFS transporter [Pseudomonadota bacterium]
MTTRRAPIDRLPLWVILLTCATIAAIGMGIRQGMGLYLKPISQDLGLGREVFSLAIAIANIVWGIAAPFTGAVSDKYGTGRVVLFGAVCTAAGILMLYAADSAPYLFVSGILLGLGVAGAGINAMVGAVGRAAPPDQRSAAIATLGIGSGIGMLIAIPYTHLLIENLGWQTSLLYLAVTAAAILPLVWMVSGKPVQAEAAAKPQAMGDALKEAFAHPSFWLLNAGFFVCGFHVVFYATHLPAYVSDLGMGPEIAVIGLSVVGIGNLIGTWLAGQWGRSRSKRIGLSVIYLARAIIFLGFLYLPITPTTIIVFSFLLGLFWLSTIPLTSGLVATFYGPVWMTMLYGIVFFSHQAGSFAGAYMAGYLFDATNSYDAMWWISTGLGVFAALIHLPINERPVPRLAAQPSAG